MESVPPRLYGGTERVVSYLTEELVDLGHHVTLFASGDSRTTAAACSTCRPQGTPPRRQGPRSGPHTCRARSRSATRDEFDVLHFHYRVIPFPAFSAIAGADRDHAPRSSGLPGSRPLYPRLRRPAGGFDLGRPTAPLPHARWVGHRPPRHPNDLLPRYSGAARARYLAVLGRMSPEKASRPRQIHGAAVGIPLQIAAEVDPVDHEAISRPRSSNHCSRRRGVEFMGEIKTIGKEQFLGDALRAAVPGRWPEPFGLSMIEAMACGTPVLAFRRGSVPEMVEDGMTGLSWTMEEAIAAVPRVIALEPTKVRQRFEQRFSVSRMAEDYVGIYRSLLATSASASSKKSSWRRTSRI